MAWLTYYLDDPFIYLQEHKAQQLRSSVSSDSFNLFARKLGFYIFKIFTYFFHFGNERAEGLCHEERQVN